MRAAHGGDADALARVHLESWRWAYTGLLPESYLARLREDELAARWWRRLAAGEMEESIRVLELDGRVRGFVTFGPLREEPSWLGYAGEIYMLYLAPDLVGRGLGNELLASALSELARHRCHWSSRAERPFRLPCGKRFDAAGLGLLLHFRLAFGFLDFGL